MRKLVTAALVIGVGIALPATSAYACDDCGPGSSGRRDGDGGVVVVTDGNTNPGTPGGSPRRGPGDLPSNPIECHTYSEDEGDDPYSQLDPAKIPAGTHVWQVCIDSVTGEIVSSGAVTWGAGQAQPYVAPQVLAQHAQAQLVLPLPAARTWPAADRQVVRIPTWLHVDNFVVDTRTATVGAVTATVRADPVHVSWNMGNGDVIDCATGGSVYVPGSSNADDSDCSYGFEHTSARESGYVFAGSVSITWQLTWTSNVGAGGDLGVVTRTTAIDWRVEQIQTVIVHEGTR